MTKLNPIPPGSQKQYYTSQRCDCGRPYITNIPASPMPASGRFKKRSERDRENLEFDWNTPPAIAYLNELLYAHKMIKACNTAGWLALLVVAFCVGALLAMVLLAK